MTGSRLREIADKLNLNAGWRPTATEMVLYGSELRAHADQLERNGEWLPISTGVEHRLKTWPEFFEQILLERKTFEIRQNDRSFRVGDKLILREFSPGSCHYSGRECIRVITYVTDWEQKPGYVVLGIALPKPPEAK